MGNRLSSAQSAYLRQHAHNPVDWWPWCAEAFAEARRRDVPVFISVGYAACHWCHVMAGESFQDPTLAALLNERFVSIKVDREEHPEVDDAYMAATQALTGQGGWPMSVFTTSYGQVFHAGTYFPPQRTAHMPSFTEVCQAVWEAWTQRRERVQQQAERIAAALGDQRRRQSQLATLVTRSEDGSAQPALTRASYDELARSALQILGEDEDTVHGGFGAAPKFPPSPLLTWLLEEPTGFGVAAPTMTAMARSALFDQVEGGFARYATDRRWSLPHFEKMLSDNAQLIGAYARLSAHPRAEAAVQQDAERTARMTISWLCDRMLTDQGLLASSLDADTVAEDGTHVEGGTYLFSDEELAQAAAAAGLTAEQAQQLTALNWGVPPDESASARGEPVHITASTVRTIHFEAPLDKAGRELWEAVLPQLRSRRAQRVQPAGDDKVVAAWNAQAVHCLAEAGALWKDPQILQLAEDLGQRLWDTHAHPAEARQNSIGPQFRISRTSYAGVAGPNPGTLADHAHMAQACFTLASTGASAHQWAGRGLAVLRFVLTEFVADNNGDLQVLDALDAEGLLAEAQGGAAEATPVDGPEPSGIAVLVQALQIAEALGHGSELPQVGDRAQLTPQDLLHHLPVVIPKAPLAVGSSLMAARRAVLGSPALRVLSASEADLAELRCRAVLHGMPTEPVEPGAVGQGKPLKVSICLNSPAAAVCLAPSSSVDAALRDLD